MLRTRSFPVYFAPLAVATLLSGGLLLARADLKQIQQTIQRDGKLAIADQTADNAGTRRQNTIPQSKATSGESHKALPQAGKQTLDRTNTPFWRMAQTLYKGKPKTIPATNLSTKHVVGSHVTTIGDNPPNGFGKEFNWDRADKQALLVLFINAADPLGVSISGLHKGDLVEIHSASGIASFANDTGNPLASGIVGLLAAGANVAADATGNSELAPVISAAQQFAQNEFKGTNNPTKLRDAYGVEPSTGNMAYQEGGLVVCLPGGVGTYYSGDDDHKDRWASQRKPGAANRDIPKAYVPQHTSSQPSMKRAPAQVTTGTAVLPLFFPSPGSGGHNSRSCQADGEMYILAWDLNFGDNAGFYKVFVRLTKDFNQLDGLHITVDPNSNPPPIFKSKGK